MKKDNVILIGFMGCGKSTIGTKLSYAMKRSIIDIDKWIERKQGRTISEIFAEDGEAYFRKLETDCIQKLIQKENHQIIATGGGLPVTEKNHELLKKLGTVIYLRVTPQMVYKRLKGDRTRPLLQTADPEKKIQELLEKRAPFYEKCADRIIDTENKGFDEIIKEIIEINENFSDQRPKSEFSRNPGKTGVWNTKL